MRVQFFCFAIVALSFAGILTAEAYDHEQSGTHIKTSENTECETIVLLQAMGRGRASLWVLDTRLQQAGYKTVNFPFVAYGQSIDDLAQQFCSFIRERVKTKRYHIIAHSLGNLIVRAAFRYDVPEGLCRIIMLAPPNQPAELTRVLRDNPIYKWFTGESGQELASDEFYRDLPIPPTEFGIIAGTKNQSFMVKEPNDGVITVESTKLEGMKDWITVPQSHTFIMNSRLVASLCISFLEHGLFDRNLLQMQEIGDTSQDFREDSN